MERGDERSFQNREQQVHRQGGSKSEKCAFPLYPSPLSPLLPPPHDPWVGPRSAPWVLGPMGTGVI